MSGLPSPSLQPDSEGGSDAPAEVAAPRVLRRFRIVFNAVKSHFQQVERKVGIGGAQVWALSVVATEPGIGVGRLARAMDIHQTTASNLVKALVGRDMLRTERASEDRRLVRLYLQPEGERVLQEAPGPFSGVLPEALARLEPAVLARLDHDLGALIAVLQADESAARIPLAHQ